MSTKKKPSPDSIVREIKRRTRRKFSAEEKIRIILEGLRGEHSNGAIAIAVLVSSHDEYILEKFHSYCLVDQGMFHLTDLHKTLTKDRRFLILVGDKEDYGRDLKIRGAKLIQDSYQLLGYSVESRILQNTGHELTQSCKRDIGTWVFEGHESNE